MAAQALFAVTVVGTVALNAADILLRRLHKRQAKKALMEKDKAREQDQTSSEEEEDEEDEEDVPVIARRNSHRHGNRSRQGSVANSRLDTSVQDPRYSRNRSPLPGSAHRLSPNSNPRFTPASSTKPDASLGRVYQPRANSFPTSNPTADPAVTHQVALASSIVDEHKRDRPTRRRFSSADARAAAMPLVTAPPTQKLLAEHENENYRGELDPLLSQLREQRQQRDRDVLFKPTPKPQSQWQLEQYNPLPEGNIYPASLPINRHQDERIRSRSISRNQDEIARSPSINRNQDALTRSQSYGTAASTPPTYQRRASQPTQRHIPEIEERRQAAEYLASRTIRSPVARSMASPPLRSGSVSSQQTPGPTNQIAISNPTPTPTDDFRGVPPMSRAGRSSSNSTGYGSFPRDYSATVADEASEVYVDGPIADAEMPEPRGSMVDRWLGDTDAAVSEKRGYPSSQTYFFDARKPIPQVYVSEVTTSSKMKDGLRPRSHISVIE